MRFLLYAAFALTLVAFGTGLIRPLHDARLHQMRGEFAALRPVVLLSHSGRL
jgi:hypothetical protein